MSIALRTALFFGLWLVIAGGEGLVVGLLAACGATAASLRLIPPMAGGGSAFAGVRLVLRVLVQSVVAGVDVMRRVFDPRLPLSPGLLLHMPGLPQGGTRDAFTAVASLAPGALPAGTDAHGAIVVHALDTRMPILADLAATEALLTRAAARDALVAAVRDD